MSEFTCSWFYLIKVKSKSLWHCGCVRRCHDLASIARIFWNPSSCCQLTCYLTPLSAAKQQKHPSAIEAKQHFGNLKRHLRESHDFDGWLKEPIPPLTWPNMWLESPCTALKRQTFGRRRPFPHCAKQGFWRRWRPASQVSSKESHGMLKGEAIGIKKIQVITESGNSELKAWHNPHGCAFQCTNRYPTPTSLLKLLTRIDSLVVKTTNDH